MTDIVEALRAKFRTPGEALKALGLDGALLKGKQPRMGAVARVLRDEVKKRTGIAQDAELQDLLQLLDALKQSEQANIETINTAMSEGKEEAVEEEAKGAEEAEEGLDIPEREHTDAFEEDPTPAKKEKPMAGLPATAPNGSVPALANKEEDKAKDMEPGLENEVAHDDPAQKLHALLSGKLSPEELKAVGDLLIELAGGAEEGGEDAACSAKDESEEEAEDEDEEEKAEDNELEAEAPKSDGPKVVTGGKKGNPGAMDAATVKSLIETNVNAALAKNDAKHRAIRKAYSDVKPYVGELAMDAASADEVYRTALKMREVPNADKIHSSALLTVLELLPKAGAAPAVSRRSEAGLAQDAKAVEGFNSRFPNLARIQH